GKKVAQVPFGGRDWRQAPEHAARMFHVFGVMRALHELLWYLTEALTLEPGRPVHGGLVRARGDTRPRHDALAAVDVNAHRRQVDGLLLRASELARAGRRRKETELRGADLIGRRLRGADLQGANL